MIDEKGFIRPKFPKPFKKHDRNADLVFGSDVTVTAKADGSQLKACVDENGELHLNSRKAVIDLFNPPKLFGKTVQHFLSVVESMRPGVVYYGESITSTKHNSLEYGRVPQGYFVLFGVYNTEEKFWVPQQHLKKFAQEINVEPVPIVYQGPLNSWEKAQEIMDEHLNTDSFLGGCADEGVVLTNYDTSVIVGGQERPVLVKMVSDEFKEVHRKSWSNKKKSWNDVFYNLADSLATEQRWNKAIQHLREKGELDDEMGDLAKLIPEVLEDIKTEEAENIKQELFDVWWNRHHKQLYRGFPEYYREYLFEQKQGESYEKNGD